MARMTAEDERAAVVAYLTKQAAVCEPHDRAQAYYLSHYADAISRGDHITPGGE